MAKQVRKRSRSRNRRQFLSGERRDPHGSKEASYRLRGTRATSANLFTAIGGAFVIVGIVDIGILWTPLRLGVPGWEFATITQTLTNVPMTIIGWTLVAFGMTRHPKRHPLWARGVALMFGVMALVLVGMGLFYGLSLPALVQAATPETVGGLKRAVLKSGTEIVIYPTACAVAGAMLWRMVEKNVGDEQTSAPKTEAHRESDNEPAVNQPSQLEV